MLLRNSASVLVTALRNTTVTAVLCLVLAIYCARIASVASGGQSSTPVVRFAGLLLAALLLIGQLSTAWGEGKPPAAACADPPARGGFDLVAEGLVATSLARKVPQPSTCEASEPLQAIRLVKSSQLPDDSPPDSGMTD